METTPPCVFYPPRQRPLQAAALRVAYPIESDTKRWNERRSKRKHRFRMDSVPFITATNTYEACVMSALYQCKEQQTPGWVRRTLSLAQPDFVPGRKYLLRLRQQSPHSVQLLYGTFVLPSALPPGWVNVPSTLWPQGSTLYHFLNIKHLHLYAPSAGGASDTATGPPQGEEYYLSLVCGVVPQHQVAEIHEVLLTFKEAAAEALAAALPFAHSMVKYMWGTGAIFPGRW